MLISICVENIKYLLGHYITDFFQVKSKPLMAFYLEPFILRS